MQSESWVLGSSGGQTAQAKHREATRGQQDQGLRLGWPKEMATEAKSLSQSAK